MILKLIPADTHVNFLKYRFPAIGGSVTLLVLTVALLFAQGLNFGIDFTGGALVQIQLEDPQTEATGEALVGELRQGMKDGGIAGATIQNYGEANEFLIRLPLTTEEGAATAETAKQIQISLQPLVGEVSIRRSEFVGPQIGAELREKGLLAVIVSLLVILVYISARFEMRYGVGAVVALCHDVLLTVGVFSLMQKEVTLPVLAALLTIIGYSLNDTIVVFDRIRENRSKDRKSNLINILNLSLNQTLGRTLMTSITTLLVLAALFVWGGEVIHDFAFTLLFGVLVGTYSSIFIASPVLLLMENYYKKLEAEEAANEGEKK